MIIKVVSRRDPGAPHVRDTFFVGPAQGQLQSVGTLTFGIEHMYPIEDRQGDKIEGMAGEWTLFQTALALGAQRMNGDLEVIFDGDEEVTRQLEVEAHEH